MILKDFKTIIIVIFLLLASACMNAQFTISGTVTNAIDNEPVTGAEIYIYELSKKVISDSNGAFTFENVKSGTYKLVVFSFEYAILENTLEVNKSTSLSLKLETLGEKLSEVVLVARKEKIFALNKLKAVEGTAIYEGKKSEVVLIDNLTANLASGTARQLYAQVVGLNIYDNSDAGLQLNIGGRGLDPNRTASFNTRQNGYDISADVLGYPESYYTPPAEGLDKIEVVRGAASLQYGTQFGGLINFKMKQPNPDKEIEWISRQTLGSNNLFTSFNSLGGTVGKTQYYAFYNYKTGNGFRPNSEFDSYNGYIHVNHNFTDRTKLTFEFSYLNYLAHQPGGLTDQQFEDDPTFSNRTRNWFNVDWKLYSMRLDHAFSSKTDFSLNLFALDAFRKSVGFRENRVSQEDDLTAPRELIVGNFNNWGAEARVLTRYNLFDGDHTFLIGSKYYQSKNSERQGPGTNGADADFSFANDEYPNYSRQSDFEFPNLNLAIFAENIFKIKDNLSITPGIRFEYIKTESEGEFKQINLDIAGNPILNEDVSDNKDFARQFVLLGVGVSYKPLNSLELYGNFSQNYRSVTFNDIRINNPSLTVDPDISDESGYTFDLGARGRISNVLSYDIGGFLLRYDDRLGVILRSVSDIQQERFRSNIGDAITYGLESFVDFNVWEVLSHNKSGKLNVFANMAFTGSEYISSEENNVVGNKVEFIPDFNIKTGIGFGYKDLLGSLQYTYLSSQFTDATNSPRDFESQSGIIGEIPAYDILDLSVSYSYKNFKLETGVNNLLDNSYFTRRATGYPGPGILPSQPRTFYTTLQFKL
ncbi:TonB-dependent receptor [Cellulophaga sp. HaHaR_3_176]|uniref:TonB-dependent receptor n=1 Tax=Cellulophaga sp. HaHaR_3_176 TaxID=1942464 RepID=UPI001C20126C|nr:TonB-dependent receptor [Cellulophaga sp. HaHaR_3_176]QWX85710.1 TonB-dependent receptor [Cellulophaga sp. HaHaR_3_176]